MKILVAFHSCMDLGGIINHTEQLIGGLKDLGHDVHFREFVWAETVRSKKVEGNWRIGPSGVPYDQGKGWNFPSSHRIPYRTWPRVKAAQEFLSWFDLVIWTVPVPSQSANNRGNSDWVGLYDLPPTTKQIAFSHDGNAEAGYPHILAIADKLSAIACVHACALKATDYIPVNRGLILNPQHNPVREVLHWDSKLPGFFNMQTFKAWKRVHELVEAIAYMPKLRENELRHVIGDGIERRYMRSEDKCKENYFHDQNDDWFSSMKFWDAALVNGMTADSHWQEDKVSEALHSARVLVDPSWSKKYAQKGGHWNRVVVDAMIHGCIPVAREMGMGTELFEPWVHYVPIDQEATPQEYAERVLSVGDMDASTAATFREANLEILPRFDRKNVAGHLIDLAYGEIGIGAGTDNPDVRKKAEDIMFNHYGVMI